MLTFEKIRELRHQRRKLWEEAKQMIELAEAEQRDLTAEEKERWQKIDDEIQRLTKLIEHEERLLDLQPLVESRLEARAARYATGQEEEAAATPRRETVAGYPAYRRAFERLLRYGKDALIDEEIRLLERGRAEARALGTTPDTAGGYLVPAEFARRIAEQLRYYAEIREVAEVVQTDTGAPLPWPVDNEGGAEGEIVPENGATTEGDPTFSQAVLQAFLFSSKLVRVSIQLLSDAGIDLEEYLGRKLGERIGRIQARMFTTGTGTGEPEGVVTAAQQGKVGATGQTTSVTYDDLVDLMHSVDVAYRRSPSCRWMFHDTTLAALKKLKDSQGRPIWMPGVAVREPDTILGFRYIVNPYMPQMAAGAKSILFGDFSKYIVRDVRPLTMVVLRERFAELFQVAFVAYARADGKLLLPEAIKYYQNSAT